jgi:hypothetical protein
MPDKRSGPHLARTGRQQFITPEPTVPQAGVRIRWRAGQAPTARASVLVPAERRTWWHYLVRCVSCGAPHLGRARELAGVTRRRRLPCGHSVVVVVARVYGQTSGASPRIGRDG